jgi:inner membrane protein
MTSNLTIKGVIVGALILLLLIPALFIDGLVRERASRKEEVFKDVASKWASDQTVTGPVLLVPYISHITGDNNQPKEIRKLAYFLPEHLRINTKMQPEIRYRSIYQIVVYNSDLQIDGDFTALPLGELNIPAADLLLSEARLCVGLTDFRGIEEQLQVGWDNQNLVFNAGVPENTALQNGLNTIVPLSLQNINGIHRFSIHMALKGSDKLLFTPLGKTTKVDLASSWKNPSFDGSFLPTDKNVTASGFTAHWEVLHLNRSYPQSWTDGKYDLNGSAFGVSLFQATDLYTKTDRSVKYAILFIGLTFALYFFLEIFQKKKIHPLQYVLVGLALCIFYTLLLSVSEYLGFNGAYATSGTATVLLVGLYTGSVFGKARVGWVFGIVLGLLYGFIYVLIQLEDGALLFGSIGLFAILALVMYYARQVDWYKGSVRESKSKQ